MGEAMSNRNWIVGFFVVLAVSCLACAQTKKQQYSDSNSSGSSSTKHGEDCGGEDHNPYSEDSEFSKQTADMLADLCRNEDDCDYKYGTCLNMQIVAMAEDKFEDDWPTLKESATTVEIMDEYLDLFVLKTLQHHAKIWRGAIEDGNDFQTRVGLATSLVELEAQETIGETLAVLKERIKKEENDEKKDVLIEMYSVVQHLSEQTMQPTGSLRDFTGNVNEKTEQYKKLKTKLEFI
jgi:hypothetical protein